MTMKFYTSVAKGLKLRKFWGLILTFVKVTNENFVVSLFGAILNKIKREVKSGG